MEYERPFFWCEKIPRRHDVAILCPDAFETELLCKRRNQHTIALLKRFISGNPGSDLDGDLREVDDYVPRYLQDDNTGSKFRIAEARAYRRKRIIVTQARKLLKKLLSCRPRRECGSGACAVCTRQYRRWHTADLLRLVRIGTRLLLFTFAPGKRIPADEITRKDMRAIRKRLLRQLRRKGKRTMQGVGWVDLKVRLAGFFEPHIHLIVFGCTADELLNAEPRGLRSRLAPGAKRKGKPVNPWDVREVRAGEEAWAIGYTVRQLPKRGEAFFETRTFRDRYDPLEVRHLLFKDRCKLRHRLVLFRVQKKNGKRFRSNVVKEDGNGW